MLRPISFSSYFFKDRNFVIVSLLYFKKKTQLLREKSLVKTNAYLDPSSEVCCIGPLDQSGSSVLEDSSDFSISLESVPCAIDHLDSIRRLDFQEGLSWAIHGHVWSWTGSLSDHNLSG